MGGGKVNERRLTGDVWFAENVLPHPAQKRPFRGCCPWLVCWGRRRRPRSPGGPVRPNARCRGARAPWTARATAAARPGTIKGSPAPIRSTSTVTPPCLRRCTLPRGTRPTLHPSATRLQKVWLPVYSLLTEKYYTKVTF